MQILKYDWHSGATVLAAEKPPQGEEGNLIIDFTWIVERCLNWLQTKGTSLKNPFLRNAPQLPETFHLVKDALSNEQAEAAECLLSNMAAYVWGPPGTGKTRYVLAHSVVALVFGGKKVLVTAPTNLAVDHALDAILSLGRISQDQVLRIGEPTEEFLENWPDCCEQRVFERQWEELQRRIADNERRIETARKLDELASQIKEHQSSLNLLRQEESECRADRDATSERLEKARALAKSHEEKAAELRSKITVLEERIEGIGASELETSVRHLEAEHVSLITTKLETEQELARLGFFARTFTSVKGDLQKKLGHTNNRLPSVETTLQRQRAKLSAATEEMERLRSQTEPLRREAAELQAVREEANQSLRHLMLLFDVKSDALNAVQNKQRTFEAGITAAQREIAEIRALEFFPSTASEMENLAAETENLRQKLRAIEQNLSEKAVLGMTLDGFIGFTMQRALQFDHVFLDEAAYAPLAKALPLLILGCPLTMLGDHLQLPPICEVENNDEAESYWRTSALYLEQAFEAGVGDQSTAFVNRAARPPDFHRLTRRVLTRSFRFGPSLARLLDEHIYHNGLQGTAEGDTSIKWISCPPLHDAAHQQRVNHSEIENIVHVVGKWLRWNAERDETLAVLTPYRNQVDELWRRLRSADFRNNPGFEKVDVLTVHRAQGREWDTVFFSVSDTGRLQGNTPFLADTAEPKGRPVVNTAISRARKQLRFFLDDEFWRNCPSQDSLLSGVVRSFPNLPIEL